MNQPTSIGVIGHYNLLERLDNAGPGELYRARDTHHGRTVVVRVLPGGDAEQDALLQHASALTSLSHQNAITVFDVGEHEGRGYVAFERITGRSLRAEMAGRSMNARRAVELAIEIADAVAEAHALGFFHSGLSPDAIGITAKGHAKIPAFHLGTTLGFDEASGGSRLIDYVSPEEARGEPLDERADVYSIGAVLYEMLTARRPMHRGASAPSASNPQVTKVLDEIVLKAVAPNPDRRYQTVVAFCGSLRGVVSLLELPEVPEDLVHGSSSAARVVATTVGILAVLAVIVWWLTRS